MTLTGQGRFSAIAIHDEAYHNIPLNLQRAAQDLLVDRIVVYGRDITNETVVHLDTDESPNLTTTAFEPLFAQVRQPKRSLEFYQAEYERLCTSAQQRGETNATYLTELTELATQLS